MAVQRSPRMAPRTSRALGKELEAAVSRLALVARAAQLAREDTPAARAELIAEARFTSSAPPRFFSRARSGRVISQSGGSARPRLFARAPNTARRRGASRAHHTAGVVDELFDEALGALVAAAGDVIAARRVELHDVAAASALRARRARRRSSPCACSRRSAS